VVYEITPEPDNAERKAILAALEDETEQVQVSAWADALLPDRGGQEPDP
jgi:hypothetical protein